MAKAFAKGGQWVVGFATSHGCFLNLPYSQHIWLHLYLYVYTSNINRLSAFSSPETSSFDDARIDLCSFSLYSVYMFSFIHVFLLM